MRAGLGLIAGVRNGGIAPPNALASAAPIASMAAGRCKGISASVPASPPMKCVARVNRPPIAIFGTNAGNNREAATDPTVLAFDHGAGSPEGGAARSEDRHV